jgi:hypothetical protein
LPLIKWLTAAAMWSKTPPIFLVRAARDDLERIVRQQRCSALG